MTMRPVPLAARLLAMPRIATAQGWPAGRAITIVVPYAPDWSASSPPAGRC